jgi:glycolate oxidase FAD binding subunit
VSAADAGAAAVLRPGSEAELAELLRERSARGRPVLLRGGGTRLASANPPREGTVPLETGALAGVLELDAEDGVVQVAAGTSLRALAAALAGTRLEPPLEAAGEASTVGGSLAAAAVGPRDARPRDRVLGLGVVLATGEITRCGGRVVKNVTGYDLMKLHVGAFGTLGVISEAWLRLRPAPERVEVLVVRGADAARGLAAARLATARVAALAEDGRLVVELAGDEPAVAADRARLADAEPAPEGAVEALRAAQHDARGVRVRVTVLPARVGEVVRRLAAAGGRVLAYPGPGLVWARFPADADPLAAAAEAARAGGGGVRIEAAPAALRARSDAFGEQGEAMRLQHALKARFDPAGILNPGVFAGRVGAAPSAEAP